MTPALIEFRDRIMPALAPEARDIYVLEHPAEWQLPVDTAAFTIRGRHIGLRDHLCKVGQWQGWRPAIIFIDQPADPSELLGLALHELAHALPFEELADVEPTAEDRQKQEEFLLAWQSIDPTPLLQATPWLGHATPFVRRALHLVYRAALLRREVGLPCVMDCGTYRLSGLWKYRRALGDEPKRMAGCSFREIEETPMPVAFRELFEADCRDWERRKEIQ